MVRFCIYFERKVMEYVDRLSVQYERKMSRMTDHFGQVTGRMRSD